MLNKLENRMLISLNQIKVNLMIVMNTKLRTSKLLAII